MVASSAVKLDAEPRAPRIAQCGAYRLRFARNMRDLRAVFRLRFLVFNLELGEGLERSYAHGYDRDEFDNVCEHLMVQHKGTGQVVGTYRMQTGRNAQRNLGYYSGREFDLSVYEGMRHSLVEVGRASIHRDHRRFEVLSLLWRGIAHYAQEQGARYLIGCSSVHSQDPREAEELYRQLRDFVVEPALRTVACEDFRVAESPAQRSSYSRTLDSPAIESRTRVPKLLRAYLSIGAKICGPPAIDREFKTIDFLTLLDLERMSPAASAKFLGGFG